MAEDILHDEVGEGDKVLITHEGDDEELSFDVREGAGSASKTKEFSGADESANGESEAPANGEVGNDESSSPEASAAAPDEE